MSLIFKITSVVYFIFSILYFIIVNLPICNTEDCTSGRGYLILIAIQITVLFSVLHLLSLIFYIPKSQKFIYFKLIIFVTLLLDIIIGIFGYSFIYFLQISSLLTLFIGVLSFAMIFEKRTKPSLIENIYK
jgi:hypothetical protein